MKSLTKITAVLFVALLFVLVASSADAAMPSSPSGVIEMHFLKGVHVSKGGVLTAELSADTEANVELSIVNEEGKCFGEKNLTLDSVSKLVRFKVTDIPSGLYHIKVTSKGRTQSHPFVVQ